MKTLAYIPLHYGAEYLNACIKALHDHVEKIVILYTSQPSYGHSQNWQCPESEQELKDIAFAASSKVEWVPGIYTRENQHRSRIMEFADGYDLILSADADEVWHPEDIQPALKAAYDGTCKRYGIDGFVNHWKRFSLHCHDGFRPIRIVRVDNKYDGEGVVKARIYHFGYCQKLQIIKYKWSCHGHHNELRDNWLEEKMLSETLTDLHPVAIGLWNAADYDTSTMPEVLKNHPNFTRQSCL